LQKWHFSQKHQIGAKDGALAMFWCVSNKALVCSGPESDRLTTLFYFFSLFDTFVRVGGGACLIHPDLTVAKSIAKTDELSIAAFCLLL